MSDSQGCWNKYQSAYGLHKEELIGFIYAQNTYIILVVIGLTCTCMHYYTAYDNCPDICFPVMDSLT